MKLVIIAKVDLMKAYVCYYADCQIKFDWYKFDVDYYLILSIKCRDTCKGNQHLIFQLWCWIYLLRSGQVLQHQH